MSSRLSLYLLTIILHLVVCHVESNVPSLVLPSIPVTNPTLRDDSRDDSNPIDDVSTESSLGTTLTELKTSEWKEGMDCPPNWTFQRGYCYKVFDDKSNITKTGFDDAMKHCQRQKWHSALVKVENQLDLYFVNGLIAESHGDLDGYTHFWLGGRSLHLYNFTWIMDGSPVNSSLIPEPEKTCQNREAGCCLRTGKEQDIAVVDCDPRFFKSYFICQFDIKKISRDEIRKTRIQQGELTRQYLDQLETKKIVQNFGHHVSMLSFALKRYEDFNEGSVTIPVLVSLSFLWCACITVYLIRGCLRRRRRRASHTLPKSYLTTSLKNGHYAREEEEQERKTPIVPMRCCSP